MSGNRILREPEVRQRTGLSRMTRLRMEKADQFPKRVRLTQTGRIIGHLENEVEEWIENRVRGMGWLPKLNHRSRQNTDTEREVS